MPARREYRSGSLWLRGDRFYLRYRVAGKQKAVFLVVKDDEHHSKTCSAVRKLVKGKMAELGVERTDGDQKLSDFWKSTYLPHVKANLRPSTLHSYEDMWTRRIEPRFGKLILTEVKSSQITEFLSALSNLNRNSVNHVRSLLSGIFSHAAALGKVPFNPVREARVLSKPKPNQETKAYSLEHLENIISALVENPRAQLVVALCGFLGLRPSEVNALDWSDVDFQSSQLHLRRAWVGGEVSAMKTTSSVASIPLIQPVLGLLKVQHVACGSPSTGWVFPSRNGKAPFSIKVFVKKQIIPTLKKKEVAWHGLYAGRRGAASILTQLTGSPISASQLLRHSNISTTMTRYIKADRSELAKGMLLLEEKVSK
jgi:integrase